MADFIFNIAKGALKTYGQLGQSSDAFIMIPIESSGVESDATIKDYDTVAAILAATTNEQTTMGRKTLANVTVTVDDTNDLLAVDCDDVVWTAATGNAVSDLLVCYDDNTGSGTDANLVPLAWYDFALTPDGTDVTARIGTAGLFTSA